MTILLYVIALTGPLVALVFGTHAGWSALALHYPAWVASLGVALAYLLLASLAAIFILVRRRTLLSVATGTPPANTAGMGMAAFKAPVEILEASLRANPWQTLGVLTGFGALLATKPNLVASIIRILTRPAPPL
ncbi:hypothetical protein [Maricaulis sp. CAU 1757]